MKKTMIIAWLVIILTMVSGVLWAANRPDIIEGKLIKYKDSVLVVKQRGGGTINIRIDDKTYLRSFDHKPVRLDKLPVNTRLYAVILANGVASNVTIQEVPQ